MGKRGVLHLVTWDVNWEDGITVVGKGDGMWVVEGSNTRNGVNWTESESDGKKRFLEIRDMGSEKGGCNNGRLLFSYEKLPELE
jgi:hypothetical protein